jgi:hypothetical protein
MTRWPLPILLGVLAAAPASARESLTLDLGAGMAHDNNILQYSNDQITRLVSGSFPVRYSIAKAGDVLWRPSAGLSYENARPHGRRTELSVRASGEFHGSSSTADFHSVSAAWREHFGRGSRLTLAGSMLPGYYLRQLTDDDVPVTPTSYRRAQFDLTTASVAWRQRVAEGASLDLGYAHEQRTYNADFRERDSGLNRGELGFNWTRPKDGGLWVDAGYARSVARASDGDDAGLATPDDVDISWHGPSARILGRVRLGGAGTGRVDADLALETERRTYDSNRAADRYHLGRADTRTAFEAGVRWHAAQHLDVRASFRHEANDAKLGAAAPPTSDAGSFSQNVVGLSVDFSRELWARARRAPGAAE